MLRILREDTAPRPSVRAGQLRDRAGDIAAWRGTNPRALVRDLHGDLDWITMKALEKDRARRYASASELASDLRLHLYWTSFRHGTVSRIPKLSEIAR
jgi:hypothetical protein